VSSHLTGVQISACSCK